MISWGLWWDGLESLGGDGERVELMGRLILWVGLVWWRKGLRCGHGGLESWRRIFFGLWKKEGLLLLM
jgi:hypothetical protein